MSESPAGAWRRLRRHIEVALLTTPTHAIEDVERMIEAGQAQFWPGEACAVVTEIAEFPKGRMLNFWLMGGDLKELLRMRTAIEAWGRDQGCRWASGSGRIGWGRILERHGYRGVAVDYMKELR